MHRTCLPIVVVALTACSSEDPSPEQPEAIDRAALLACESESFEVARALVGPGLDEQGFVGEPLDSYVIHTTQIVPRPEKQQEFFDQTGAVVTELVEMDGLVAFSLALDNECGDARTLGVWASEEAMYAFVGTKAHVEAMSRTPELSLAGRVAHWSATPEEVLTLDWDAVKARLAEKPISPIYP